MSVIRQLSLLGADGAPPEPEDLAGLLLAGGRIMRTDESAQLCVDVGHPWRASAIVAECARRGLAATQTPGLDANIGVRTAYAPALLDLARAWTDEVGLRAPRGLQLDGRVMRLWAIAVGRRDGTVYVLPVAGPNQAFQDTIAAALAAVGVVAQLSTRAGRGGAPGEVTLRIAGRRRLDRLVEMVGDAPKQAPPDIWPS